jgi:formamidopyrimidine-DNA glycosylase
MPELPEVETMVRGIRPHVEGREIAGVRRCRCRCKPITVRPSCRALAARLKGRAVSCVERLAKRVLLRVDSGDVLAIEPRMTGLMLLADPPDRSHLRIKLQFADSGEFDSLWFWDRRGLGTVTLYTADEVARELGPPRLGADALDLTADQLRHCCARTKREIKVALLDQRWIAGIGNLYASEILHTARIHPQHPADRLTSHQRRRLLDATHHVLRTAILYEGSTLSDGTYRNALSRIGRYQNEHRVYGRAGETCPRCRRGKIERIVQAQRSTFFCPRCQRELRS